MKTSTTIAGYQRITFALLVLLALTVSAAYFDLGIWSTALAMLIAVTKAVLITLFFMHVYRATPLIRVVLLAGLFWLAILLFLAMSDYLTRG